MQAMGPEAAVLSARMAELRATYVDWDAELPRESAMWAEAAIRAADVAEQDDFPTVERAGVWVRFRAAFARRTPLTDVARDDPRAALACLPLRAGVRR